MKLTEEKASVLRRNIDISLLILPVGLGDIIETIFRNNIGGFSPILNSSLGRV